MPVDKKLLSEDKLIWSPVVANSRMNRERNASGINSYEQEFKFKPEAFLEEKIRETGSASWLDLCCGFGKALIQVAEYFQAAALQDKVCLQGIDLIENFLPPPAGIHCLQFRATSVLAFSTEKKFDLITCVHGIHYLGDKLKVIQTVVQFLKPQGLFIGNLDLNNIKINGAHDPTRLKALLRKNGLEYNARTRILKRTGFATIHFDLKYIGSDDSSGPNYTGQEAVTSYYAH